MNCQMSPYLVSITEHYALDNDIQAMMGPELFCLLLGPPGFNCWFYSAPVFQWWCSTPQGSPGVGRNTFLSSPHLCFITVFVCDLFVSRDDPLMRVRKLSRGLNNCMF